ncbi:MAG: hypothetical protein ACI96W_003238 [Paraglaciecola sp.]
MYTYSSLILLSSLTVRFSTKKFKNGSLTAKKLFIVLKYNLQNKIVYKSICYFKIIKVKVKGKGKGKSWEGVKNTKLNGSRITKIYGSGKL